MPEAARSSNKEYWRPANIAAARIIQPLTTHSLCPHCEAEYSPGASFCHVCGEERDPRPASRSHSSLAQILDIAAIRRRLGLSGAPLFFLVLGIAFMVGALLTGFVYRPGTVLDWQAVQMWRVEWLLASAAAMLAGILLKKKDV